jgi:hypothetical protein
MKRAPTLAAWTAALPVALSATAPGDEIKLVSGQTYRGAVIAETSPRVRAES